MKKSALALSVAAALGFASTASAITISAAERAAFEPLNFPAEFYNVATGFQEDGLAIQVPVFAVSSLNPSNITLSATNADLGAPTSGSSYYLAVLDSAGKVIGFVIQSGDTATTAKPVQGTAVDGQIQFNFAGGLNTLVRTGETDGDVDTRNLTSTQRLQLISTDLNVEDLRDALANLTALYGDLNDFENDAETATKNVNLLLNAGLNLGSQVTLTVSQSGSSNTASIVASTIQAAYKVEAARDFDRTINVNTNRETFVHPAADPKDALDANQDEAQVVLSRSDNFVSVANAERALNLSVASSEQGIASLTHVGAGPLTYADGAWVVVSESNNKIYNNNDTAEFVTEEYNLLATLLADTNAVAVEPREFTFSAGTAPKDNHLNLTYATEEALGEWGLNGHQAYVPYFPMAVAGQTALLRVTNNSTTDGSISVDLKSADGEFQTTIQLAEAVPAQGSVWINANMLKQGLNREDLTQLVTEGRIHLQVVTSAPENQVMVTGVLTQTTATGSTNSDLPVYNRAGATVRGR